MVPSLLTLQNPYAVEFFEEDEYGEENPGWYWRTYFHGLQDWHGPYETEDAARDSMALATSVGHDFKRYQSTGYCADPDLPPRSEDYFGEPHDPLCVGCERCS